MRTKIITYSSIQDMNGLYVDRVKEKARGRERVRENRLRKKPLKQRKPATGDCALWMCLQAVEASIDNITPSSQIFLWFARS